MADFKWSNSSLTTLLGCGERWRRRYIEQERVAPVPKQLRGRVVHEVAQHTHTQQLESKALPSVEQAHDEAATCFDAQWSEGVLLDPEEKAIGEERTKSTSKDFAIDLAGYHVQTVAPRITPIAVEEHMTVVPANSDLIIHGIIDLIALSPAGDEIHDLKTAERSPSADTADKSSQLSFYSLLWYTDTGHFPHRLTLNTLVRTPTRNEKKFIPLHTTRDQEDMNVLIARLNTAVDTVKAGRFLPAPADSWLCGYCEFRNSCPFVRRGERRPTT